MHAERFASRCDVGRYRDRVIHHSGGHDAVLPGVGGSTPARQPFVLRRALSGCPGRLQELAENRACRRYTACPDWRHLIRAARRRVRPRAPGSGEAGEDRSERARRDVAARRRAVGVRAVRRSRVAISRRARESARPRARPPRLGAIDGGARPSGRCDERGAGGAEALAARPRDSSHRRDDLRAHAQVRGSGGGLLELRQPAAQQRSQREGRLVPRRDPVPAVVRPESAVRHRAGHRRPAVHGRLPPGQRESGRAREGQRLVGAGFRGRHRIREHRHHAEHGAASGHPADHLHAERRRRPHRPPRSAARAHRLARNRLAEGPQHPVSHQEPAAARHPDERNGEPVAARARLLDGHRLQDASSRSASICPRSPRTSSCRCAFIVWPR